MSVSLGTGVSFGNLVTSTINPLTGGIENVNAAGIDVLPEIGARQGRKIGVSMEQPAGIARAVISSGKLAARFASGQWTTSAGAPTLTQGYTGWDGGGGKTGVVSRTGMPDMLKVVPAGNTTEEISLGSVSTNMLTQALAGKLGLWMYLEAQPGYQVGGTIAGTLSMTIGTNAATSANALSVGFNTNQLREGWNFLTFVMRNPLAYQSGSGQTEYHPFGVNASGLGTGADSDIVNSNVNKLKISWQNMQGATLYFDSIWTAFSATPQIIFGCDGGSNLAEIALPIFSGYGWVGYSAQPFSTVDSGTSNNTVQGNLNSNALASGAAAYAAGWDVINHTVTHPSVGGYTSEAAIAYQLEQAKAWLLSRGYERGCEFYASPQSNTSRLSETVIKSLGYKLQRHVRKWNTSITPFGLDNPHHIGSIDIGSASQTGVSSVASGVGGSVAGWQIASKIKRAVDVAVDYGDTVFMFWHGITTTGDSGTGEDATGDNLLITASAFASVMSYIRTLEVAGVLRVPRALTGFWYEGK